MPTVDATARAPWVPAGGAIEPDESALQAAVRECEEEAGLPATTEATLGYRIHAITRRELVSIACAPAHPDAPIRVAAPSVPASAQDSGQAGASARRASPKRRGRPCP